LRILFLSETFYPHGGGAELATYLYARLLKEEGFNVTVVTNRFVEERQISNEQGITVFRLPLMGNAGSLKYSILSRPDVLVSSFIRKLVKSVDIVYIPRFWYSSSLLARACRKPVITHLHDYMPVCPLSNLHDTHKGDICFNKNNLLCSSKCIYAFERGQSRSQLETMGSVALNMTVGRGLGKLVALSDAIICVSNAHKNLIAARAPHLQSKMHLLYNPLPNVSYLESRGRDFGYFGGPSRMKGFEILYKAILRVKNSRIRVHATKFSESARSCFQSLIGQFLFYDKAPPPLFERIWKEVRAIVVPSVWQEPLPYIVSEALLRGRLVIASIMGGIPEQLEGTEGNLLCDSGDFQQFANSMDYVSELDDERIAEFGWHNRERVLRRFDNGTIVKEFVRICDKVV